MKLRTIVTLFLLVGTVAAANAAGHTLNADIFLAAFFIVLGLSRP